METDENMTLKELEKLKEEKLEIDREAFDVNEGICKDCNEKLTKIVENRSMLDGAVTFHIIKLRCEKCGKEYLDLDQAEKYDFLLTLEKATKKPLDVLSKKISS
jgi:RNase P subunit RPR2